MKTVLITGATGFAGSFLTELLVGQEDIIVHGTYISEKSLENIAAVQDKATFHKVDLTVAEDVFALVEKIKPDEIYHLAALPSPADSYKNPVETLVNNIGVEVNIFEAVVRADLRDCRILITSSADIYGNVKKENLPVDEDTPLNPASPYAVSKIAQDYLGLQYFLARNLQVIRVRPFNHIGPRQSPAFVVSAFAKQIAEIEQDMGEPIVKTGNLDARKDFTDVRDMVQAYVLLLAKGSAGDVYNIGSGKSVQIKDLLEQMLKLSAKTITHEVDPVRLRPNEEDTLVEIRCDASKMENLTGWKPEIPLEKSLQDTLDYWRKILYNKKDL